jgi:hypothetical protein
MGGQYPAVFLEQQFSGILGSFNAQFMTPYIESVEKRTGAWRKSLNAIRAILMCNLATPAPIERRQQNHSDRLSGHAHATQRQSNHYHWRLPGFGPFHGRVFRRQGAKLALVDLNQEKLDDAVAACKAKGVEARAYLCNVANEEQVTHMWPRLPKISARSTA